MGEPLRGGALDIEIAGQSVVLLPERALWWPAQSLLVIADLHLGKGLHFRNAGIAVPAGGTGHDLRRLDTLLAQTGARRLLVLGDLLHTRADDAGWRRQWLDWRQRQAAVSVELVTGNHDRALAAHRGTIDTLGVYSHGSMLALEPFRFVHDRQRADGQAYSLGGHLHPVIRLPGLSRLPVFRFDAAGGELPAFTAFAGGWPVVPEAGTRLFVCAPDAVVAIRQRPFPSGSRVIR